jgi:Rrf2 family protein
MNRFPTISEASSIAIHSLALIAATEGPLNANRISEETGFSRNHISKVMQTLARHGYLESGRGPKGGFEINETTLNLNLLEIIELIEGPRPGHFCGISEAKCPFENCVFGELPAQFIELFRKYYSERTIRDIRSIRKTVRVSPA